MRHESTKSNKNVTAASKQPMKHLHKLKHKTKHKTKHIRSHRHFKKGALFAAVFAGIGLYGIIAALAATPTAHFEAESANRTANASVVTDSTASGGQAVQFGSGNTTQTPCTPGTLVTMPGMSGTHGPCILDQYIPAPMPGVSVQRLTRTDPIQPGTGGEPGAFRQRCDFSHMNRDDPVLYPNQPNRAHLHTFFGNTGTNASSTSTSLKTSGNSTCAGGIYNRSAYWVPTMIDTATGRPITPGDKRRDANGQVNLYVSDLEIYYKKGNQGTGYYDTQPFPNGLHLIAGYPANATGSTPTPWPGNRVTEYWCETSDPQNRSPKLSEGPTIPTSGCPVGGVMVMRINFPQCWKGGNDLTGWRYNPDGSPMLDSNGNRMSDGRSHMAYGRFPASGGNDYTTGCPPTHPVPLPYVQMIVRYMVPASGTASWRLSSDNYASGPGGWSGHADYMFAWEEDAFETVVQRCYQAKADCGYQLGDGRAPLHIRRCANDSAATPQCLAQDSR